MDRELSEDDVNKYKAYYHDINKDLRDFNVNRPVFYGKFLRNLMELKNSGNEGAIRNKCRKLNNWLYVIRKKRGYTFDEMRSVLNLTKYFDKDIYKTYKCGFEWLLHEKEFENIIKLYNFNEHIHNIKEKISNITEEKYAAFCQYVHGCIATYNKFNKSYCNNKDNKENSTLCKELELFEQNYDEHVVKLGAIIGRFPRLKETEKSHKIKCTPPNQRANRGTKYARFNAVGDTSQSASDQNNIGRLGSGNSGAKTKVRVLEKMNRNVSLHFM
ncbi:variable surface protein Vir8-like [Plasmodium vivax]|uniref:Variable surface protein Vir8-like n=1 Tax=Plasmodium vivax (strain Salvador I) TaxID=126793 RepID=A5KE82_PLAVS|nr:variable surface protein Vir8-like [Plasmodium vivax]EDL42298.1 variable surface protein Vir8-like [Plasmodium vivax]|eukprot:XP_001608322.1 variable surface protein Vir8-like [Plasmodium vivax Sal-1]